MIEPQDNKHHDLGRMWLGVIAALGAIALICIVLYQIGPENEPPPVNDTRVIDAGLQEGCELRASMPGSVVPVYFRPNPGEMIVGDIPHDTVLDTVSVRGSWVEVRGPVAGWVDRRYVVSSCP